MDWKERGFIPKRTERDTSQANDGAWVSDSRSAIGSKPADGPTGREKIFPSVVLLVMPDANGQPMSLGSGFFVGDGIVATNQDVIAGTAAGHAKLIGNETTYQIDGVIGTA
jgi:hypothetical protein